jgi:ribosomal protein L14
MMVAADNSGALIVRLTGVKRGKVGKGRQLYARIADHVKVSVRKGLPEMKGKVFDAINFAISTYGLDGLVSRTQFRASSISSSIQ